MLVKMFLSPSLAEFSKEQGEIIINEGATAKECIIAYGVPIEEVGIIQKNGIKISPDDKVYDGDAIKIYPLIISG